MTKGEGTHVHYGFGSSLRRCLPTRTLRNLQHLSIVRLLLCTYSAALCLPLLATPSVTVQCAGSDERKVDSCTMSELCTSYTAPSFFIAAILIETATAILLAVESNGLFPRILRTLWTYMFLVTSWLKIAHVLILPLHYMASTPDLTWWAAVRSSRVLLNRAFFMVAGLPFSLSQYHPVANKIAWNATDFQGSVRISNYSCRSKCYVQFNVLEILVALLSLVTPVIVVIKQVGQFGSFDDLPLASSRDCCAEAITPGKVQKLSLQFESITGVVHRKKSLSFSDFPISEKRKSSLIGKPQESHSLPRSQEGEVSLKKYGQVVWPTVKDSSPKKIKPVNVTKPLQLVPGTPNKVQPASTKVATCIIKLQVSHSESQTDFTATQVSRYTQTDFKSSQVSRSTQKDYSLYLSADDSALVQDLSEDTIKARNIHSENPTSSGCKFCKESLMIYDATRLTVSQLEAGKELPQSQAIYNEVNDVATPLRSEVTKDSIIKDSATASAMDLAPVSNTSSVGQVISFDIRESVPKRPIRRSVILLKTFQEQAVQTEGDYQIRYSKNKSKSFLTYKTIRPLSEITAEQALKADPIRFKHIDTFHGMRYISIRADVFIAIANWIVSTGDHKQDVGQNDGAVQPRGSCGPTLHLDEWVWRHLRRFLENQKDADLWQEAYDSDDESFINGFRL